jgi:hypothetical protein
MLLNKFYWTRIWIIQEVALAKKLKVRCGRGTVEWDALCLVHRVWNGFSRMIETTTTYSYLDWYIEVQNNWEDWEWTRRLSIRIVSYQLRLQALHMLKPRSVGPWFLEDNLRARQNRERPLKLLHLLGSSFNSFATDPRDKIYGMLGLANDLGGQSYHVDYTMTERAALQYLVQHCIETTRRLDVLCYASFHAGLQSWVPYWGPVTFTSFSEFRILGRLPQVLWAKLPVRFPGQRRMQSFAPLIHSGLENFLRRFSIDEDFAAAGTTDAEARIEEEKGKDATLIAAGCVVDQIVEILNPTKPSQL